MHSCFFILFLTRVSDILDKIFNNIITMSTEELQDMESRIIEAAKRVSSTGIRSICTRLF